MEANHCVCELSVPCVCLFHCVIATEFDSDYRIQYNRFRVVLHAVDSLNVKHKVRLEKIKQFCMACRHFQTIFLSLSLENSVLLFA